MPLQSESSAIHPGRKPRAQTLLADATSLASHIIRFDATDPSTYAGFSLPLSAATAAAARNPIPWPSGKAPVPAPLQHAPNPNTKLPQCDYVIVTWTVEEARCLADTLTPGFASSSAWYHYTHNYASTFVPLIRPGAPALTSKRLASWFPTVINGKRVLCMKSELHFSQDGAKIPVALLWQQIIAETGCKLIITTGTAGGVGDGIELGDVVVAQSVRFDCMASFKSATFHDSVYDCPTLTMTSLTAASVTPLLAANAGHLPAAARAPRVIDRSVPGMPANVITTDFFAFDDSDNTFDLQGLGSAVEMGDAVLGMVIQQLGSDAPRWASVRNASDPQIASAGLTEKEEATKAAQIYERFGYWTTISSAIASWALVLDN